MSDTPRTDELAQGWDEGLAMPSQMLTLARQLERELTVANNWVEHHQNHCDDLIKENARLRMELDASCSAEELRQVRAENAALRAELEAEAVVNGKGSEREVKLLAEVAALRAALKPLLRHRPDGDIGWRGNTKAKCGWILVSDILRVESALGKEAQP